MMSDTPDPFELIRREAVPSEPSVDDYRRARQSIESAISREQLKRTRIRRGWLIPSLVTASVLFAIASVAILRSTPAEAALGEVAAAARAAAPLDVPQGSFIYTRSERVDLAIRPGIEFGVSRDNVAYLLSSVREVWRDPDTNFIQIRTTVRIPEFFDPAIEAAYYTSGLDRSDQVGETRSEQFTGATDPLFEVDWPTEPGPLHEALVEYAAQGGDRRPETVSVFDLATDLLREADPSPQLRGAILDVLAALPVQLVNKTDDEITIAVTYDTPVAIEDTITLSRQGVLLAETTTLLEAEPELKIPARTVVLRVDYLETRITKDL